MADLEQKFNELFGLCEQVVREMGGEWQTPWGIAYEVLEANFTLTGRKFRLVAERSQTPAYKGNPGTGVLARAGIQWEDRKLADFLLPTRELTWKVASDGKLIDVDADNVREVLKSALADSI